MVRRFGINDRKRRLTRGPVNRAVVCELSLRETRVPLPRFLAADAANQISQGSISDLCLAVGLRVRGAAVFELGIEHQPQRFPEMA